MPTLLDTYRHSTLNRSYSALQACQTKSVGYLENEAKKCYSRPSNELVALETKRTSIEQYYQIEAWDQAETRSLLS